MFVPKDSHKYSKGILYKDKLSINLATIANSWDLTEGSFQRFSVRLAMVADCKQNQCSTLTVAKKL